VRPKSIELQYIGKLTDVPDDVNIEHEAREMGTDSDYLMVGRSVRGKREFWLARKIND